jgi:hypothetical protein
MNFLERIFQCSAAGERASRDELRRADAGMARSPVGSAGHDFCLKEVFTVGNGSLRLCVEGGSPEATSTVLAGKALGGLLLPRPPGVQLIDLLEFVSLRAIAKRVPVISSAFSNLLGVLCQGDDDRGVRYDRDFHEMHPWQSTARQQRIHGSRHPGNNKTHSFLVGRVL